MVKLLKTSTGCVTCRRRRKKCDESKPVCGACSRLKLLCTWRNPTSSKDNQDSATDPPPLPRYQTGQMVSGFQAFSSQTEFHFAITGPQLLSTLLSVAARPLWSDTTCLLNLVLTRRAVRSALVAFSAKTKSYEIQSQQALWTAERAYHSSIIQTQELLAAGIKDAEILPAIAVILCMGLFEALGGNFVIAAEHYSAVLLLISAHTVSSQVLSSPSERQFFLVALELALLFVSGISYFQPSLRLLANLEWPSIRTAIARYSPSLSSANHLPSLDRHDYTEIFICTSQIASLARTENTPTRPRAARSLWLTVEELDYRLKTHVSTDSKQELDQVYFHRWALMIDALRIVLLKIMHQGICSADPLIKRLVKSGLSHLQPTTGASAGVWTLRFPPPFSNIRLPMLGPFWWFFVLVCAVDDDELPHALQVVSDVLSSLLGFQERMNMLDLIALIKRRKRNASAPCDANSRTCSTCHDGLDALIHTRGIFGILEDEALVGK